MNNVNPSVIYHVKTRFLNNRDKERERELFLYLKVLKNEQEISITYIENDLTDMFCHCLGHINNSSFIFLWL